MIENAEQDLEAKKCVWGPQSDSKEVWPSYITPESLFGRFVWYFRRALNLGVSEKKAQKDMQKFEKLRTREGINFSRCQMGRLVEAYNSGIKLEIDCFSPYLSDYNLSRGEMWDDKLMNADKVGLNLAKYLREFFPKSRLISLYDEYNTVLRDSANEYGAPTEAGEQITLSPEVKQKFKKEVERLLRKFGGIKEGEEEYKDYLLISESEKIADAEILVGRLEKEGKIARDGQAIFFINEDAENPIYEKIELRKKDGHWMCAALDASSFLKPENQKITHLVVLPEHFKEQQDKVWEILRVLGIKPDNYHNIFYPENDTPEHVIKIISEEIKKYQN